MYHKEQYRKKTLLKLSEEIFMNKGTNSMKTDTLSGIFFYKKVSEREEAK